MQQLFFRLAPVLGDPGSPVSLPARAAFGVAQDFWIWAGVSLGAYALAVWWYAARFAADAAAISGLGSRKRRKARGVRAMRGGLNATLVRKEWRLLWRDPLLLSQILLQLLYLAPFFLVFATRLGREGITRFDAGGFASGFVILVTSLAASLAWLCVSAEDAPDLIASAPVPREQMDNVKAFAAAAPAAALLVPPVIGAALLVSPMAALWLLIGGGAAITSTCLIAIWYQAPGNRKEFRRRTRGSLLLNLGRSLVAFAWIGATGLAVGGLEVFAIIPAVIALALLLAMHESRPKPEDREAAGAL
jgi:ABC-2 type transport system permease protein